MDPFNSQPTLRGNLLQLRPLTANDFDGLFSVASDPIVWEQHPERFRYKREVFEPFFQGAVDSRGALTALDNKSGEVIGSSRFTKMDPITKTVEVGYTFLAPRCWGLGYNTEMKNLMLAHAFAHFETVYFWIGETNFRSRKAIEKLGARLVQQVRRNPTQGIPYNAVQYSLVKQEN